MFHVIHKTLYNFNIGQEFYFLDLKDTVYNVSNIMCDI